MRIDYQKVAASGIPGFLVSTLRLQAVSAKD